MDKAEYVFEKLAISTGMISESIIKRLKSIANAGELKELSLAFKAFPKEKEKGKNIFDKTVEQIYNIRDLQTHKSVVADQIYEQGAKKTKDLLAGLKNKTEAQKDFYTLRRMLTASPAYLSDLAKEVKDNNEFIKKLTKA